MGPGMGPGGGVMSVLTNEQAQKDLGLSEDQISKLREAGEKLFSQMRPPQGQGGQGRGQRGEGGGGNRPAFDPEQFRARMEQMQKETRSAIEGILNSDQIQKLDVMVFQSSGGLDSPFINVENLRVLNLTDDQKKKITDLQASSMREGMRRMEEFQNMSEEERRTAMEEARERMQASREKQKSEILAVLTDEQKTKAASLSSETPDYLKRQERGGPGGPRGGREGRNARDFGDWTPGQGGGEGRNASGEARRERPRQGRSFPGTEE